MAVPKGKVSKARRDKRRSSHWKLAIPGVVACPKCGEAMRFDSFHVLDGSEDFLDRTLHDIGIPLLHIVGGRVGMNTTYYEFTADEAEIFEGL